MSVVFKAEKREKLGSAATKKIKRNNRIPSVIYNKDGNINLSLDVKEFEKEYFKGNSFTTVVEIELDGKKIKAIAHKIDLDPVSDRPVHVDFINCDNTKIISAKPRIKFINRDKSPGIKRGGFLNVAKRRVEIFFEGKIEDLPTEFEIDLNKAHLGQKIRAADLKLPNGVSLKKKHDFLIASIIGRGKSEDKAEAATEGEATEGASEEAKEENKAAE